MIFKEMVSLFKNRTEWLRAISYFGVALIGVAILSQHMNVLISETDSLPHHFFLHLPQTKPGLNDYTVVESQWYQGKIIKRIVGIAGDLIKQGENGEIYINHRKVGTPKPTASDGTILNPIKPQIIPTGYVFLSGEHPKSFDSRYQELGLVPALSLQGLVIPLG